MTHPVLTLPIKIDEPLADKLALILWYLSGTASGRLDTDERALHCLLDDPAVAAWLDRMNKAGRIKNTRFTQRSSTTKPGTGRSREPQKPFANTIRNHIKDLTRK
jgi:hypothetical protein